MSKKSSRSKREDDYGYIAGRFNLRWKLPRSLRRWKWFTVLVVTVALRATFHR